MIKNKKNGFMILESIVALIIFAVAIVGVIQYQNNFLQATADSYNRTIANYLVESLVGQVTIDQPNLDKYVNADITYTPYNNWLNSVSNSLPKVNPSNLPQITSTTVNGSKQLTITIFWQNPFDSIVSSYKTQVLIF